MNVFYNTTACGGRFNMKTIACSLCHQSSSKYVTNASRSFASQREESSAFSCKRIFDHHVFCGTVYTKSIPVTSRLQTEIIIIAINITVLHQYPGRRINIYTISARPLTVFIITNTNAVNGYMIRIKNLDGPESCIGKTKVFECYIR